MGEASHQSSGQAVEEEYVLNKKAPWQIVGKPKIKPTSRRSQFPDADTMRKILDRSDLSDDQKLELLQGEMTEEQRRKVEELLESGLSVEQVNLGVVSDSTVLSRFLTISPERRRQPPAGKPCWPTPTCHSNRNWTFSGGR